MRITVTDACIFIDLLECHACEAFFQLSFRVVTSYQVWMELENDHREILRQWIKNHQLMVIKIEENFVEMTRDENLSRSLSIADRSVWFISKKEDGILLTSDGMLRKMAKKHRIDTHGLLWVFDRMVREQLITTDKAISKLQQIFNRNSYYRTDSKLTKAFESLKRKWKKV